jgi:hypothetical protein
MAVNVERISDLRGNSFAECEFTGVKPLSSAFILD